MRETAVSAREGGRRESSERESEREGERERVGERLVGREGHNTQQLAEVCNLRREPAQ
jgi:hypothetical protein